MAAGAVKPAIREYDLGPATIEQAEVSGERRNLPYRIQGLIAVPPGDGPHPLIVVTHGSHPGCPEATGDSDLQIDTWPCPPALEQRNDLGWRYLLEALAGQGYVAVAPNMNAINTLAWGEFGSTYERYAGIVNSHLAQLAVANQGADPGFGLDLAGRIDFSRTALVGHSQGGGYAMIYAAERNSSPVGPLAAVLLVAPAFQLVPPGLNGLSDSALALDLPTGIVMGLCDGDVSGLEGFIYYGLASAAPQRANIVQVVVPYGANHNFFNAALGPDVLDPLGAPGCDRPAGRLDHTQQQAFLSAYAHDFFAEVFDGVTLAPAWQAAAPAPQRLYDVPVLTDLLLPSARRRALLPLIGEQLPADLSGVVASAAAPLVAEVCRAQSDTCRPSSFAIPTSEQYDQRALRLSWEQPGGELRLDLPTGQRDLSAFAAIQLRVALDGYEAANAQGQALHLRLRDAVGAQAEITIPAETLALQPPTVKVRDADQPRPYLRGIAPLAAVRVPLAEFAGVDLTQIDTITLVFDQSDRGVLLIADLELLR
jgi:dienelactone hydrolase